MLRSIKSKLGRRFRHWQQHQFDTSVAPSMRMSLDPWEYSQAQLRHGVPYEPLTCDAIKRILGRSDVYVDVGANIGYTALVARQCVGESGLIIAVEPQPYLGNKILNNFYLNGFTNLHLYIAACGDVDSRVHLHDQLAHDRSRLSLHGPSKSGESPLTFRVPILRLATILEEMGIAGRIKLIKIDVEGFEPQVVRGLGSWLQYVDNLVIEIWDPQMPKYVSMCRSLMDSGFSLFDITGEPWNGESDLAEINLLASR